MRKPYLKTSKETGGVVRVVGAVDKSSNYTGPCARVSSDKDWLHIITDDYEGHAMLNIEALPALRQALTQIARELKQKP